MDKSMSDYINVYEVNPALAVLNIGSEHLSDREYIHAVYRVAIKCNIEKKIEEYDDRYKVIFYLENSILDHKCIDDWLDILRSSDMHTMTAIRSKPHTIRVTCYRIKRT